MYISDIFDILSYDSPQYLKSDNIETFSREHEEKDFGNESDNSIFLFESKENNNLYENFTTNYETNPHLKKLESSTDKNVLFEVNKNEDNPRPLRGRKRKKINLNNTGIHTKYSSDNLLIKTQVHFISFIIYFSNAVLDHLGDRKNVERFVKVDYKFKKNANQNNTKILKNSDIGYVLCQNISRKFKKDKDYNKKLYNEVIKDDKIKYLLSLKYLDLFKNVYYKNIRKYKFNIGDYEDIIDLFKAKMYEDFLEKNYDKNKNYKIKLEECAYNNYIQ